MLWVLPTASYPETDKRALLSSPCCHRGVGHKRVPAELRLLQFVRGERPSVWSFDAVCLPQEGMQGAGSWDPKGCPYPLLPGEFI